MIFFVMFIYMCVYMNKHKKTEEEEIFLMGFLVANCFLL